MTIQKFMPPWIDVSADGQIVIIDGVSFDRAFFKWFESGPLGQTVRITSRSSDGAVTVEAVSRPETQEGSQDLKK